MGGSMMHSMTELWFMENKLKISMIQINADVFFKGNLKERERESGRDCDMVRERCFNSGLCLREYTLQMHQTAHSGTRKHVIPIKTGKIEPQFSINQTMSLPANTSNQSMGS